MVRVIGRRVTIALDTWVSHLTLLDFTVLVLKDVHLYSARSPF